MCEKHRDAPTQRPSKSYPLSHFPEPENGYAALKLVALAQFQTRLTSAAAASSHAWLSVFTFRRQVLMTVCFSPAPQETRESVPAVCPANIEEQSADRVAGAI